MGNNTTSDLEGAMDTFVTDAQTQEETAARPGAYARDEAIARMESTPWRSLRRRARISGDSKRIQAIQKAVDCLEAQMGANQLAMENQLSSTLGRLSSLASSAQVQVTAQVRDVRTKLEYLQGDMRSINESLMGVREAVAATSNAVDIRNAAAVEAAKHRKMIRQLFYYLLVLGLTIAFTLGIGTGVLLQAHRPLPTETSSK